MDGLEQELLRNFQEAGVFEFAAELGIIEQGTAIDEIGAPHLVSTQNARQPDVARGPSGSGRLAAADGDPRGLAAPATTLGAEVAAAAAAAVQLHKRKRADEGGEDELAAAAAGDDSLDASPPKKKRTARTTPVAEKGGKGLRHFSMKVCEKVESKGRTTYNEVADELVKEFSSPDYASEQQFDEKNIRRRVYDALNVLMAMNIISKEKKDITWRGLPASADTDVEALRSEKLRARQHREVKHKHLVELLEQHGALAALLARNAAARQAGTAVPPGSLITLPFILVQTRQGATVEVGMSEDSQVVHLDFNSTSFEIRDDIFVTTALLGGA